MLDLVFGCYVSFHIDLLSNNKTMGNVYVVGPNEALIISGGCCGSTNKKMIIGNWAWAWWAVNDVQLLSLEVFSLKPKCEHVETLHGVPICVTGVAQCKIMTKFEFLKLAAEQFLGMTITQIRDVLLETLEGHLRAMLGTLSIEEIYKDRDKFAKLVREMAAPDVEQMGIEIVSFTIKDIYDSVEYLASLGRSRVAQVKRDAQMGVAQAERDAGIQEAQCHKESMDVKFETNAKIEDAKRNYEMMKAQYDKEVNTELVDTKLAYELQSTKLKQMIRNEEKEVELIKKKRLIDLEHCQIDLKDGQLDADVRVQADAEAFRIKTETLAKQYTTILMAEAEAQRIKIIGKAEAERNRLIGIAQANAMKFRAEALANFNDAAILSMVMEILPDLTREIAKPLNKTSEIVITTSSQQNDLLDAINKLITQIPTSVKTLSGVDLNQYLMSKFSIDPDPTKNDIKKDHF